jgi:hypothetical protein
MVLNLAFTPSSLSTFVKISSAACGGVGAERARGVKSHLRLCARRQRRCGVELDVAAGAPLEIAFPQLSRRAVLQMDNLFSHLLSGSDRWSFDFCELLFLLLLRRALTTHRERDIFGRHSASAQSFTIL